MGVAGVSFPEVLALEAELRECLEKCRYGDYLKTWHWQRVRNRTLVRYNHRCAICSGMNRVEAHHRSYDRRGAEEDADVIALCHDCHELFHEYGSLASWK